MKTCSKCTETKTIESFSKNGRNSDGRHPWCKVCFATYERERYKNGDSVRKIRNNISTQTKRKEFVWNYLLKHPCVDCGEIDPVVLEFDHNDPTEKTYTVTTMYGLSQIKIQQEIDKCTVRCCNCHRRRTTEQFGWWRGAVI